MMSISFINRVLVVYIQLRRISHQVDIRGTISLKRVEMCKWILKLLQEQACCQNVILHEENLKNVEKICFFDVSGNFPQSEKSEITHGGLEYILKHI